MPNKLLRYSIAFVLLLGLISVRIFEEKLFYDPLLDYFHNANRTTLPPLNTLNLFVNVMFRFLLNLLLTVFIVKMIFWKQNYVKFTIIVGIITLAILLPLYAYMVNNGLNFGETIFFYVRRFLIQPMLLIILIPCFYYQEIQHKKATQN